MGRRREHDTWCVYLAFTDTATIELIFNISEEAFLDHIGKKQLAHYAISIQKDSTQSPPAILIVYTCKHNDPNHRTISKTRLQLRHGTKNLNSSAETCDKRHPERLREATSIDSPPVYSESRHRALIALRCASSKRSFHSLLDPLYHAEVELLRPGTRLPVPQTSKRDLLVLYHGFQPLLTAYFLVCSLLLAVLVILGILGLVILGAESGSSSCCRWVECPNTYLRARSSAGMGRWRSHAPSTSRADTVCLLL